MLPAWSLGKSKTWSVEQLVDNINPPTWSQYVQFYDFDHLYPGGTLSGSSALDRSSVELMGFPGYWSPPLGKPPPPKKKSSDPPMNRIISQTFLAQFDSLFLWWIFFITPGVELCVNLTFFVQNDHVMSNKKTVAYLRQIWDFETEVSE